MTPENPSPQAASLEHRIDTTLRNFFADVPRMGWWLAFAVLGLVLVWYMAPQMVKVTVYKLTLLPAAAWVLYRIDRAISERRRPHELLADAGELRSRAVAALAEGDAGKSFELAREAEYLEGWARDRYLRRTILIAAGLVAVALGS